MVYQSIRWFIINFPVRMSVNWLRHLPHFWTTPVFFVNFCTGTRYRYAQTFTGYHQRLGTWLSVARTFEVWLVKCGLWPSLQVSNGKDLFPFWGQQQDGADGKVLSVWWAHHIHRGEGYIDIYTYIYILYTFAHTHTTYVYTHTVLTYMYTYIFI